MDAQDNKNTITVQQKIIAELLEKWDVHNPNERATIIIEKLNIEKRKNKFEDLPIIMQDTEYKDGWSRTVNRQSTIAELLKILDINDSSENSSIAQVLRHLRDYMSKI